MAAELAASLPDGTEWFYEVKWDGYRAVGIKYGAQVGLLSRNEKSLAGDFPTAVEALGKINADFRV